MKWLFRKWREDQGCLTSEDERRQAREIAERQRLIANSLVRRLNVHEKENNFSARWELAFKDKR